MTCTIDFSQKGQEIEIKEIRVSRYIWKLSLRKWWVNACKFMIFFGKIRDNSIIGKKRRGPNYVLKIKKKRCHEKNIFYMYELAILVNKSNDNLEQEECRCRFCQRASKLLKIPWWKIAGSCFSLMVALTCCIFSVELLPFSPQIKVAIQKV